jgi:hypothetical protein
MQKIPIFCYLGRGWPTLESPRKGCPTLRDVRNVGTTDLDLCSLVTDDFVVFTEKKKVEKLRYMHRNPERGLVLEPQQWPRCSFCDYAKERSGPILVNEPRKAELHLREVA